MSYDVVSVTMIIARECYGLIQKYEQVFDDRVSAHEYQESSDAVR